MKKLTKSLLTIIDRKNPSVKALLKTASKYAPLTPQEEMQAIIDLSKAEKVAEAAREKLILHNLRFVVHIASQYQNHGIPLEDLFESGCEGLIHSIEHHNGSVKGHFASYASFWIRQHIINSIEQEGSIVRAPMNQLKAYSKYKKMDAAMVQEQQRHLTLEEFYDFTGIKLHFDTVKTKAPSVMIDAPLSDESDCTFADTLSSDDYADSNLYKESLHNALKRSMSICLDERERDIVCKVNGFDCIQTTMRNIADEYHLSHERTRKIYLGALKKMRMAA